MPEDPPLRGPSTPPGIDHAVVIVRDRMDVAHAAFARLGFTLTPRGEHQLGSVNHLVVFDHDYLELLGFPPGRENARPEIAASPIGLDGLVLGLDDVDATHAALAAAGFAVNPPTVLTRPVRLADGEHEARFTTIRFAQQPIGGGRLYFCRHETPDLVWRPEWMVHPNGACGLARFTVVVADPLAEARRYAAITGTAPVDTTRGSVEVPLHRATIELLTHGALRARLGDLAPDARATDGKPRDAYMAMLTFRTRSVDAARWLLARAGVGVSDLADGTIAVAARDAFNTTLAFTAG